MNSDLLKYESSLWALGLNKIVGIDEAGRGPLAGPLVAAAVIMPTNPIIEQINDSKKLSEKRREELFFKIKEIAVDYCISVINADVIDKVNILNAAKKAFLTSAEGLKTESYIIYTDAMPLNKELKHSELIKGDAKVYNIAAASILAKHTRDQIMCAYSELYPEYNFDKHKGYGTKEHKEKIKKCGICPIHRKTFLTNILNEQITFNCIE